MRLTKWNKVVQRLGLAAMGLVLPVSVFAAAFTGNATPTTYTVTLQDVSFHRVGASTSAFTSYASGSGAFDIASATAGNPVGTLQSNGVLGPGDYDQMRFQVSKFMTVSANYSGAALPNGVTQCRTVANATKITDPFGDGSVSVAYLGSTDGGAPEASTIEVPSGSSVDLPAGFTSVGGSLQGIVDISGMSVGGDAVPNVTVSFDVTNSVMFAAYGASGCVVFPGPPTVTTTIA